MRTNLTHTSPLPSFANLQATPNKLQCLHVQMMISTSSGYHKTKSL